MRVLKMHGRAIELWVKGHGDEHERMNARFTRDTFQAAYDRACIERDWYQARGYATRFCLRR